MYLDSDSLADASANPALHQKKTASGSFLSLLPYTGTERRNYSVKDDSICYTETVSTAEMETKGKKHLRRLYCT